jgi:two-component system sensor histidine kinase ChvG
MTVEAASDWAAGPRRTVLRAVRRLARLPRRLGRGYHFTSITRRIVVLNVAGLIVLVIGILLLNTYRVGLIDSRRENLVVQGQIIATAIADRVAQDRLTNAELLTPSFRDDSGEGEGSYAPALNPEALNQFIKSLGRDTRIRIRVYDQYGQLVVDSVRYFAASAHASADQTRSRDTNFFFDIWRRIHLWASSENLPLYKDLGTANGKGYAEVRVALTGEQMRMVSVNEKGEILVSVGVPIKRLRNVVVGAVMLTTPEGEIDDLIAWERATIVSMALLMLSVTGVLSWLMARTIANPVRKLAAAAEQVRLRIKAREQIPDYSRRSDEIGHLSAALRDMTGALYFAAQRCRYAAAGPV